MQSWHEWAADNPLPEVCGIVGKGPSLDRWGRVKEQAPHFLVGLNEASTVIPVDAAHAIDLDVLSRFDEREFLRGHAVLVMPWHPHVANAPTDRDLLEWCGELTLLRRLYDADRLLWYNCETAAFKPDWLRSGPVADCKFFSVEAVLSLLGQAGCREVETLGIDGGATYATAFSHLTPLTNGWGSFDKQFSQIAAITAKYSMRVRSL